jgi:hypothetical protein
LETTVRKIQDMFPQTVIIWSQILPRLVWRGDQKHEALETVRRRVNSKMGTMVKSLNGHCIRYPEILDGDKSLFLPDDVHLNKLGNKNLPHRIQQAIYYFVKDKGFVHPAVGEWGPWLLLPEYVF